ncbi:MAG: DUF1476 domain-containing protein [Rhodospirillales bacterium]
MVYEGKERRKTPRRPTDTKDKGHEADFLRQGEMDFKVIARRNKLLGLWAAEKMGVTGDTAEAYSKEVVASDFDEPGDDDVVRKVMKDFAEKGVGVSEDQLRQEMDALLGVARGQIRSDSA